MFLMGLLYKITQNIIIILLISLREFFYPDNIQKS